MGRTIHNITLKKEDSRQKWGFGITGGKDVALTFRIEKVILASPAGAAGVKNLDYLIRVNDKEVFEMGHNELVNMIRASPGDTLELEIERAEVGEGVVPSFDTIFPRAKTDNSKKPNYYQEAMKHGIGDDEIPCMFTACGKPRLKTGKYNVPVGLYSDETLLELSSSGGHGFVDPEKLAPDACPAARNRKRFDPSKSNALNVLLAQEKGEYFPAFPEGTNEEEGTRTE